MTRPKWLHTPNNFGSLQAVSEMIIFPLGEHHDVIKVTVMLSNNNNNMMVIMIIVFIEDLFMACLVISFYLDFTTTYAADIVYIIYM